MARPVGHPDNVLIGQLAAAESWARTPDRAARTAAARKAAADRFLQQARDRFGDLPADELARRAEHLRKAFYLRMALRSAQSRRARKQDAEDGGGRDAA